MAGEGRQRALATEALLLGGQLGHRHPGAHVEVVLAHAELPDHIVVEDDQPTGCDGTDGQLVVVRRADLAHGHHVEQAAEALGDRGGDRHAPARQAEDHRRLAEVASGELVGQHPARVGAIAVSAHGAPMGPSEHLGVAGARGRYRSDPNDLPADH